jgi:hypothetical protein
MRSANEKEPWKLLPPLQGSVESEFIRPVHLGATLLPFRFLKPWLGVIPWDGKELLDDINPRIEMYPGLADWWTRAAEVWDEHKGDSRLTLLERSDFRRGLSLQFPTALHRVLYTSSGQYLAAARTNDPLVVIDNALYWAAATSEEEALYLSAVLNSPSITSLLAPLQARGEHNPRHFHKLVWRLPIPLFDPDVDDHRRLAELAVKAELMAAEVDVSAHRTFQAQRRLIREALEHEGLAQAIDACVLTLVSQPAPTSGNE